MKSDDYLKEIEQHRQTIQLDENAENKPRSRREYHRNGRNTGNKKKSKRKANALLTTIFGIFILIPVAILIYVSVFYEPNPVETVSKDNQLKIEVNAPDQNVASETERDDETISREDENDVTEQPEAKQSENDGTEPPEGDVNAAPPADEPEKEADPPVSKERTHVVAPGETLYRIAMNYYGSPDGIEKIKSANGLSSNDISSGQTLRIP